LSRLPNHHARSISGVFSLRKIQVSYTVAKRRSFWRARWFLRASRYIFLCFSFFLIQETSKVFKLCVLAAIYGVNNPLVPKRVFILHDLKKVLKLNIDAEKSSAFC